MTPRIKAERTQIVAVLIRYADAAIAAHEMGSRLAPPTRSPSTPGAASSDAALPGLTLPPYRIGTPWLGSPSITPTSARNAACVLLASAGVAVLPVPIAQTGSYATS